MSPLIIFFFVLAGLHIVFAWAAAVISGISARKRSQKGFSSTKNNVLRVSVLVPAWNEKEMLRNTIEELKKVDYPSWETIIIAGGPDGTFQKAKSLTSSFPYCRVIEQGPDGKNAALNKGWKASAGDVIVLLDADSIVSSDWLRKLLTPIEDGAQVVTGKGIPLRITPITRNEQMERLSTYEIHNAVTLQGNSSIALRREVLNLLGGFPEDVKVGVDWDLDARIANLGIARVYASGALVRTERPATILEFWKNEVRWRRAHLQSLFRQRHYFLKDAVSALKNLYIYMIAWFTILFTLASAIALLVGKPEFVYIWVIYMAWLLLRRASLAGEVATYTGELNWLTLFWCPPMLLLITFLAIVQSSLTLRRATVHFKGPRVSISDSK